MKKTWIPWLILAAVLASAQFWGNLWVRRPNTAITPAGNVDRFIPPNCPADTSGLEFGSICKQISTGKILYRGTLEAVP